MEINEQWLAEQKRPGNTFCPMFFVHKHVDTQGRRQLCCVAAKRSDGWDAEEILAAGLSALEGKEIHECRTCYDVEQRNLVSFRQDALVTIAQFTKDVEQAINEKRRYETWYDLRVSNLCNLACIMCGPAASSTIAKNQGIDVTIKRWSASDIEPTAKKVYLAGGEPFLIKEFRAVLQQVKNDKCEVVVNTNGTIVDTFLVAELARFSNLCITLSVDGIGDLASKIRVGTVWSVVEENVAYLKRVLPQSSFLVNTVAQKDNVNQLYQIGKWVEQNNFRWGVQRLQAPSSLSVTTLPQWEIPGDIFKLAPVRSSLRTMQILKELYNAPQNKRN